MKPILGGTALFHTHGRTNGRTDGRTERCDEDHSCVLRLLFESA
jgi:hypothetical protein